MTDDAFAEFGDDRIDYGGNEPSRPTGCWSKRANKPKTPYETIGEAARHAPKLDAKFVYKCQSCGKYHITTHPKRRKP